MKQLLKPSINFDFNDAIFENIPPQAQKTGAQSKNSQLNHQQGKDDDKKNQKSIVRPWSSQRQMTDQGQREQSQQLIGLNSKQYTQKQLLPQNTSAKSVKFDKNQGFATAAPSIQSNCYFPQQQQTILKKSGNHSQQQITKQQMDIPNNNNLKQQNQDFIKNAGIFDWDEADLDNQFIINNKKYESIEKQNLERFLSRQQKSDVIQTSIKQNQIILKQQQKEIQQKLDNIEQLRMNEILQNNLVISQSFLNKIEQQEEDPKKEVQIQQKIKNNEKDNNYELEYEQENFEMDEDNKVEDKQNEIPKVQKQLQENQSKQSEIKLDKVQESSKKVKSNESLLKASKTKKQVVYKAKNAKERKQELNNMRNDLEKYLLQNNQTISKMFQDLQDTKEKEKIMIEVNTKRQEELSQAKLTLKQLQEKFSRQQQIIEDLNNKEQHANQIIQKLTENKQKYNNQWELQVEKYMACKVIARFLKGRKDRKLFKEFRRQSFINRLKQ
ncbi:unnamed protein product (macronuclear) [Paramecium tetraurelia]|uniref:Uncharacterized protein n=1 Tax=Paramecium tetraurelia TaxID=5888 RepID=A0EFX3_PARTE|nr:uncharacterized protein GSPATT00026537001 [Paramecium tetraurelia]CAK94214.1 unnamed protein product [Paramecium tetraurelia]|eukprot:XP_001461587.1 hypothetical protein (macronuclear) [Paramecium tetraurelia strain d4-2]